MKAITVRQSYAWAILHGGTWSWSCNRCETTGGGWFRLDYCEAAALKHERETHP